MEPEPCPDPGDLAALIGGIGFACQRCGACCRPGEGDSGLVFLSRDEAEALVAGGPGSRVPKGAEIVQGGRGTEGLGAPLDWTWDEVAAPWPDFVPCGSGSSVTFGWCVRHEGGRCRFLGDGRCTRYSCRPWICRTYPFSLVEGELAVSDCPGLGEPIAPGDALLLAEALLARARAEAEDEERVRAAYARARFPDGRRCVVDSAGLTLVRD